MRNLTIYQINCDSNIFLNHEFNKYNQVKLDGNFNQINLNSTNNKIDLIICQIENDLSPITQFLDKILNDGLKIPMIILIKKINKIEALRLVKKYHNIVDVINMEELNSYQLFTNSLRQTLQYFSLNTEMKTTNKRVQKNLYMISTLMISIISSILIINYFLG